MVLIDGFRLFTIHRKFLGQLIDGDTTTNWQFPSTDVRSKIITDLKEMDCVEIGLCCLIIMLSYRLM
jgi:hypothetical protein